MKKEFKEAEAELILIDSSEDIITASVTCGGPNTLPEVDD